MNNVLDCGYGTGLTKHLNQNYTATFTALIPHTLVASDEQARALWHRIDARLRDVVREEAQNAGLLRKEGDRQSP